MKRIAAIGWAVLALMGTAYAEPIRLLNPADHCNVIVIVIDALRADHVGAYGYARHTSSFLDTLAAQGLLFEHASSHSSYTRESVSVILSGSLPSENPVGTGWFARPNPNSKNLPECFAGAGYRTAFFSDSPVFEDMDFAKGFAEVDRVPTKWGKSGSSAELSKHVLASTGKAEGKPFMMYVHYLDPHDPYDPPDPFYLRFAKKRFPDPLDVTRDVRPRCHAFIKEGFGPGEARFDDMVLRYDAEIAETDAAIEALFKGMAAQGVLDKTLVVVTADHGEEFLDHRFVEHAWTAYEEVLHVPLILWRPGIFPVARIAGHVKLADLFPTLTHLMKVPCDRTDLDGESWFALQDGTWTFTPPVKPAIAEVLIETRCLVRSVGLGGYKYIASPKWLSPEQCAEAAKNQKEGIRQVRAGTYKGVDPFGPTVHEELYDLDTDPHEQVDLMARAPEKAALLKAILDEYLAKCAKRTHKATPRVLPELAPDMKRQLENLGYF